MRFDRDVVAGLGRPGVTAAGLVLVGGDVLVRLHVVLGCCEGRLLRGVDGDEVVRGVVLTGEDDVYLVHVLILPFLQRTLH